MKNDDYNCDIAFSFLQKDEHLANQINDLIKDKFSTFLHSKKFEDLTNTKHDKKFINVFGKQSKIVVVLFRNKWGTTPWTRIEENAIRNRAFDEDQNFLIFITLDNQSNIPKYLPKVFIWSDLAKSGIKGAANIIEERVKSSLIKPRTTSHIKPETKDDIITKFEVERSKFLESVNGLEIASLEIKKLFSEVEKLIRKFNESNNSSTLSYQKLDKKLVVHFEKFSIKFYSHHSKTNPTVNSDIYFELEKQIAHSDKHNILAIDQYHFDVKRVGDYGWIKEGYSDSFISSKKLAEESLRILLTQVDGNQVKIE